MPHITEYARLGHYVVLDLECNSDFMQVKKKVIWATFGRMKGRKADKDISNIPVIETKKTLNINPHSTQKQLKKQEIETAILGVHAIGEKRSK